MPSVPTASRQEIVEQIAEVVEPFRKGEAPVGEDSDLVADLKLNSLAVMDLLMELEDRFDISISLDRVPEIRTVGDLAATIEKVKQEA